MNLGCGDEIFIGFRFKMYFGVTVIKALLFKKMPLMLQLVFVLIDKFKSSRFSLNETELKLTLHGRNMSYSNLEVKVVISMS